MSMFPLRNRREGRSAGAGREASPLARFRHEFDHLFDRFFQDPWGSNWLEPFSADFAWGPRMDLSESENEVTVRVELPAVNPEDVQIDVSGNVLTIRGEKKEEKEEKRQDYLYTERQFGRFCRSVPLPSSVDTDKVDAAYKDGILTITLSKRPEARPKRITVRNA